MNQRRCSTRSTPLCFAFVLLLSSLPPPAEAASFAGDSLNSPSPIVSVSRSPNSEEPGSNEIGGDDLVLMTHDSIVSYSIDSDSQGRLFVAVEVWRDGRGSIRVYRSVDAGDSWQLWADFTESPPAVQHFGRPSLHVAEGVVDAVFIAYAYWDGANPRTRVFVSGSPLDLEVASFTTRVAIDVPGKDVYFPRLSSDEWAFDNYYLYLTASHFESGDTGIWFTRSIDYGNGWESAYSLGSIGAVDGAYVHPSVAYGVGGYVHVTWGFECPDESCDDAVLYRRAEGFAGTGIASWGRLTAITPHTANSSSSRCSLNPTRR